MSEDNTIDTLMDIMDKDPVLATKSDIDTIIAYHRRNRANAEAGIKPKRETGPKGKLDLGNLIKPTMPVAAVKRRV